MQFVSIYFLILYKNSLLDLILYLSVTLYPFFLRDVSQIVQASDPTKPGCVPAAKKWAR